jgi:hypothetical protein
MTDAEIEAYAREFFESNVQGDGDLLAAYRDLQIQIDRNSKTIRLSVDTHVPTTFGRVFGIDAINFSADTVTTFNVQDIELGMALDVTGSMRGQKLADLQDAATELIDSLIPDTGSISDVKIGIAPYSAYVNVGPAYAQIATDVDNTRVCVFERNSSLRYDDAMPQRNHYFGGRAFVPRSCPTAEVEPLTSDKDVLKAKVASFQADGGTAGHLGLAWAWYSISPDWSAIWPASSSPRAYGTRNLIKAVILMTDGEFNTQYSGPSSTRQALTMCDEMKDKGVVIYSVAFQAPGFAQATLRSCASADATSGSLNYYDASNGDQLREAFKDIAIRLTALRIAQ